MTKKWILLAPLGILALALFAFIGGEAVRLLWNWLLPPLFGWPQVTFWQALGILALCRILFGGLGRHGSKRSKSSRMSEKWDRMTPEERERLRESRRGGCGFGPSKSESPGQ